MSFLTFSKINGNTHWYHFLDNIWQKPRTYKSLVNYHGSILTGAAKSLCTQYIQGKVISYQKTENLTEYAIFKHQTLKSTVFPHCPFTLLKIIGIFHIQVLLGLESTNYQKVLKNFMNKVKKKSQIQFPCNFCTASKIGNWFYDSFYIVHV